jgi:hypothetical protein
MEKSEIHGMKRHELNVAMFCLAEVVPEIHFPAFFCSFYNQDKLLVTWTI